MSFETLHIGNIGEALLLYVDDALSAPEKAAVDAFVQQHPQWATELELLLLTRLPLEEVVMPGKEWLFSDSMMTLELEDTLSEAELPRLSPDEPLPAFPWKESLYRTEAPVRRMSPVYRVAAAAAVVLLLAGGWWALDESTVDGPRTTAYAEASTVNGPRTTDEIRETTDEKRQTTVEPAPTVDSGPSTVDASPDQPNSGLPSPNGKAQTKIAPVKNTQADEVLPVEMLVSETVTAKEIPSINNPVVTNTAVAPLNDQTTAQTPTYAVQTETADPRPAGRRGGSLKGLLRKATRIIEARTGIETTNEDGELLIGVVAVKLD